MANEPKWTPGKWCVPDQTYRVQLTVDVEGEDLIACPGSGGAMSYTETVCTMGWNGTPEWDANAHLIAAAPDMAEALAELCALSDDHAPFGGEIYQDRINRAWDAARAALAKAKGE